MSLGGKTRVIALIAVSALVLSACGKSQKKSIHTKTDGVLIQLNDSAAYSAEEIQSIFPSHAVEIVNSENKIFKIKNAELTDVQEKLPNAYAEEDILVNVLDPSFEASSRDSLSSVRSIQDVVLELGCIKLPDSPVADMDLASQPNFVANNVVRVGSEDILFTAEKSKASSVTTDESNESKGFFDFFNPLSGTPWGLTTSDLTIRWVVEAPEGSRTQKESSSRELSVRPDKVGGYLVALIVQNPATKACALTGVMLGVTHDRSYDGPVGSPGQFSAQTFFHVPQVNADKAWALSKGDGVTIAVLDTGINYNHPDLSRNIKVNESETPNNGRDDDNNGYIDDVYGWDFAIGDKYPFDDEAHGTHVSGLAASTSFGVAPLAKILPVKVIMPTGMATSSSIVSGIYYAIKMKVDIINMSLGGKGRASPLLLGAIKKAQETGILVVVAAGNSTEDTDRIASYFTARDGTNVLAVAAVDENDTLTSYSNFGKTTVDLAAPGGTLRNPLMSTHAFLDEQMYIGKPGTSMASPVVAGAAALVKAVNPSLSPEQLKVVLLNSGKSTLDLYGKVSSGKVLNAEAAVEFARGYALTAN